MTADWCWVWGVLTDYCHFMHGVFCLWYWVYRIDKVDGELVISCATVVFNGLAAWCIFACMHCVVMFV